MSEWIEHDGACVPLPIGTMVEIEYDDLKRQVGPVGEYSHMWPIYGNSWIWADAYNNPALSLIIRYRALHFNAMEMLRQIAANPQAPVKETEPA